MTLELKHIFSDRWVNTARVGFTRVYTPQDTFIPKSLIDSLPKFHPGHEKFGSLELTGGSILGSDTGATIGAGNIYQYQDQAIYTQGKHSLKLGGEIQRYLSNTKYEFHRFGKFRFPTVTRLLQASPDNFAGETPDSDFIRGWRLTLFGFYAQDDVKLTRNLTVNVGFRYEPITNPYEVNGKTSTILDLLKSKEPTITKNVFEKNPSLKNYEPRLGTRRGTSSAMERQRCDGCGDLSRSTHAECVRHHVSDVSTIRDAVNLTNPTFPNPYTQTGAAGDLAMSIYTVLQRGDSLHRTVEHDVAARNHTQYGGSRCLRGFARCPPERRSGRQHCNADHSSRRDEVLRSPFPAPEPSLRRDSVRRLLRRLRHITPSSCRCNDGWPQGCSFSRRTRSAKPSTSCPA